MKRILALAAFLFLLASPSYGQTVTIGTSASATNPQRSGEAGTGLFTTASGVVSISSAGTEMMRVNGTGAGIGTTAPDALLSLGGQSAQTIDMVRETTASTAGNNLTVHAGGATSGGTNLNGGNLILSSGTSTGTGASQIQFQTYPAGSSGTTDNSATTGMTIAGVYVGIGTTNPNVPLEVDFSQGAQIRARYDSGGYGFIINQSASAGATYLNNQDNAKLVLSTNNSDRMTITAGGSVGIATASPANTLDIGNSGGIHITSGTPSSTSNALYNSSGTLGWNGALEISSAGQLQCGGSNCANSTGSGTLNYCPYKGNVKTTASQGNYAIPSGCLSATLTSMYVGGTGSTSVAASTLYYIYLWNTSGTWVLDAETGGHATDSSTGIEIKSGDNTKTLVGMIHTDGSKHIMTGGTTNTAKDTNTVATWDNRVPTATICGNSTLGSTSHNGSYVEVNSQNRCYFMSWGDAGQFSSNLLGYGSTTSCAVETKLFLDTVGGAELVVMQTYTPVNQVPVLTSASATVTEGYHFTILGAEAPATCTSTYIAGGETVYSVQ